MKNSIEYATLLEKNLDVQMVQQATAGWMEQNAGRIKHDGGAEVKVPKLKTTGLGNYNRKKGEYPKGGVTLSYQTLTLTQDRGAEFYFDRHDVDESNYIIEASRVLSEFQRTQVIPEIDAYRYSTIASKVKNPIKETLNAENIIKNFLKSIRDMQDRTGLGNDGLVCSMPYTVYSLLEQNKEVSKFVAVQNFEQGGISFEVKSINGVPIIPVQSGRMKTSYIFQDGSSLDKLGFKPATGVKDINYIILPKNVPIAISKTDKVKIFSPDLNQDGDGWKTQYRKYHDIWILENQLDSVIVSIKE